MLTLILDNMDDRAQKKSRKKTATVKTSSINGDVAVLAMSGKLDLDSAGLLEAHVKELSEKGVRKLALDLREVSGMDSAGLGEILAIYHRFAVNGGEVCLAELSDRVKLVFEYAKLHFVFKFFPDVLSATEYLNRPDAERSIER
jgi:stage II sporulation protein AA (anti-sigma F factor antagonist)